MEEACASEARTTTSNSATLKLLTELEIDDVLLEESASVHSVRRELEEQPELIRAKELLELRGVRWVNLS